MLSIKNLISTIKEKTNESQNHKSKRFHYGVK